MEEFHKPISEGFEFLFQATKPPTARIKSSRKRQTAGAPVVKRHHIESDSIGIFWFEESRTFIEDGKKIHRGISNREKQQLKEIVKSEVFTEDILRNVVIRLNDENSETPRLRAYDWAVTNYSKGHPKAILLKKNGGFLSVVDPNLSYEGELRKHHRLLFDPFRRGTHIFFDIDGIIHRTTVGQLTFIKWCLEYGVDKYVEENLNDIRAHMSAATKRGRLNSETKRRRELTRAPTTLVRGVLMTHFDIITDTATEREAGQAAKTIEEVNNLSKIIAEDIDDKNLLENSRKLAKLCF